MKKNYPLMATLAWLLLILVGCVEPQNMMPPAVTDTNAPTNVVATAIPQSVHKAFVEKLSYDSVRSIYTLINCADHPTNKVRVLSLGVLHTTQVVRVVTDAIPDEPMWIDFKKDANGKEYDGILHIHFASEIELTN